MINNRKNKASSGVFDGHSDLLYDVARRRAAGEKRVLERYHLDRLYQGGVEGLGLTIYVNPFREKTVKNKTAEIMRLAQDEFLECPWLEVVRTASEAEKARQRGNMYAFLSVEGMAAIGDDIQEIDRYAAFGVRMGMLTWNEENLLATGAGGAPDTGLTDLGKQAVRRMQELGIIVDVSHLNDGGFADVVKITRGPIIASHSNCRELCDVRRNLTDDQMRAIRDTGGIVGVNVHHAFVHAEPKQQTVEMLARHAAHMADVMGVEHVACGFDFCEFLGPGNEGVRGMEDCSRIPDFFRALEQIGMSAEEREMIARKNFLRILA